MNTVSGEKRAREHGVDEAIRTLRASVVLGAPRLAEPFWYQQAHSGRWTDAKERAATMSPAAQKAERRNRTKAARAKARSANMSTARERALASLAA